MILHCWEQRLNLSTLLSIYNNNPLNGFSPSLNAHVLQFCIFLYDEPDPKKETMTLSWAYWEITAYIANNKMTNGTLSNQI